MVCMYAVCMVWYIRVWCVFVWYVANLYVSDMSRKVKGSVSGSVCLQVSTEAWASSPHGPGFQATRTDNEAFSNFCHRRCSASLARKHGYALSSAHFSPRRPIHRHLCHGGRCTHLDCRSQLLTGRLGSCASPWRLPDGTGQPSPSSTMAKQTSSQGS